MNFEEKHAWLKRMTTGKLAVPYSELCRELARTRNRALDAGDRLASTH